MDAAAQLWRCEVHAGRPEQAVMRQTVQKVKQPNSIVPNTYNMAFEINLKDNTDVERRHTKVFLQHK